MALFLGVCEEVTASIAILMARRVVVAYHALGDSFPIGTLRAMLSDAGWEDEDLRRLGLIE